jgi:hypothetical protein
MTTALAPTEQATCTDTTCQLAWSHMSLCECSCAGVGHGKSHRPHFPTTGKRADIDPFTRMAMGVDTRDDADYAPATRRDIPWCEACMNLADDCDCEA